MERVFVSIRESATHQIQGSVSEFNVGETFKRGHLDLDYLEIPTVNKVLSKMACIENITPENKKINQWRKIFDPRESGLDLLPGKCKDCHFARTGCVILAAHIEKKGYTIIK